MDYSVLLGVYYETEDNKAKTQADMKAMNENEGVIKCAINRRHFYVLLIQLEHSSRTSSSSTTTAFAPCALTALLVRFVDFELFVMVIILV